MGSKSKWIALKGTDRLGPVEAASKCSAMILFFKMLEPTSRRFQTPSGAPPPEHLIRPSSRARFNQGRHAFAWGYVNGYFEALKIEIVALEKETAK